MGSSPIASGFNDLLLLSRLEQNQVSDTWTDCCLNDLVNDLAEEFLEMVIAASIPLTHHLPDHDIYVLGNESQLYRLVSNAQTIINAHQGSIQIESIPHCGSQLPSRSRNQKS